MSAPRADQIKWREDVRELTCIACPSRAAPEIHHCAGRTAKFNKVAIGHWWILPLCHRCHVLITHGPDELSMLTLGFKFVGRWDLEKLYFADVMSFMGSDVVPHETLEAIWAYRR